MTLRELSVLIAEIDLCGGAGSELPEDVETRLIPALHWAAAEIYRLRDVIDEHVASLNAVIRDMKP